MKKVMVIAAALLVSTGAVFAQKAKVTTAYNALNSYNKGKDPADLQKAKTNIDDASVHADTKDDAKTWAYRGNVYLALYQIEFNAKLALHKDETNPSKKSAMAYVEAPTANLTEATNSYLKGKALDKYAVYDDIPKGLGDCYFYSQNIGISNYNQEKYAESYPMFELALAISASSKVTDTVNIDNCAKSALNAKMYDKAIPHLKTLTSLNYGKGNSWLLLAQAYEAKGDSTAYRTTIAEGLKKYPTDSPLLTADVNLKLKDGKKAEAVAQLEALTAQKKDDPELFFIVGNVYDNMANPTDKDNKMAEKPSNYEELHNKAAENYNKAVELKPGNFDALYNLGILYYNQGVEYYNRSNSTIADAAKYANMWEAAFAKSIEYLEKARAIDPKDQNTITALKICYGQIGDSDNYNLMKEELKKLQGQ